MAIAVFGYLIGFFFLKDGPRWMPWLAAQTGPRPRPKSRGPGRTVLARPADFVRL